jgi:hypothetical protein
MTAVQADCCKQFRPREEVHLHDRPYGPSGRIDAFQCSPGKGCKAQAARKDYAAPCRHCSAQVGQPCTTKAGKPLPPHQRHRARLRAVAMVRWNIQGAST